MSRDETSISQLMSEEISEETIHGLWYDWFCSDKALKTRGKTLISRIRKILKNNRKFNPENTYVFFKNNCPLWGDGRLYDDFRICDIETGDVIYTVTPRNPEGKSTVWGRENAFKADIVNGTWKDVCSFFKGE